MSLPKINVPEYTLVVPSTDEEIKFRPFLVKEEKLLLMAQETGADSALYSAIKNLIKNCCFDKIDVDKLPLFDIEYIFLNIRAKSVEEIAKLQVICPDDGETEIKINVDLKEEQEKQEEQPIVVPPEKVQLTPEEKVRQHLWKFLNKEFDYPKGLMKIEKKILVNKLEKRFDLNLSAFPFLCLMPAQ